MNSAGLWTVSGFLGSLVGLALLGACGDSGRGDDSDAITSASAGVSVSSASASASASTGASETGEGGSESGEGSTSTTAATTSTTAPVGSSGTDPSDATTLPGTDPSDPSDATQTTDPTDPTLGDTTGEDECAAISETSEIQPLPADIIFAIDTSGSMNTEYTSVQNNMNAFSSTIVNSGVDAHVVLISSTDMCIAAPLGSGNCPSDSNEPGGYLHVVENVDSHDALNKLLLTHPQWSSFMRPNARKHVIVVSDDNASLNANSFHTQFKALGPEYVDYKFHAIVGEWDAGDVLMCIAEPLCCAFIAGAGDEYIDLVALTGGLLGDLCDQEFGPIFQELSTQVVEAAPLPCEFDIPEPMGMDIDYGKVNVDIDVGGMLNTIPKVEDEAECAQVDDGWFYDDPQDPQQIILCPETCALVQGDEEGGIEVSFGCETLIPE